MFTHDNLSWISMLRWLSKPCLNGSAQLASDCNGNVCQLEISLAEFEAPHTFADRPNQKSDANQRKNQDGQSLGIFQVSLLGNEICTRKGDQNPEQRHRPRTLHGRTRFAVGAAFRPIRPPHPRTLWVFGLSSILPLDSWNAEQGHRDQAGTTSEEDQTKD